MNLDGGDRYVFLLMKTSVFCFHRHHLNVENDNENVILILLSSRLLQDAVDNGPYYVHLGHAPTRSGLRAYFEKQLGIKGATLRFENVF